MQQFHSLHGLSELIYTFHSFENKKNWKSRSAWTYCINPVWIATFTELNVNDLIAKTSPLFKNGFSSENCTIYVIAHKLLMNLFSEWKTTNGWNCEVQWRKMSIVHQCILNYLIFFLYLSNDLSDRSILHFLNIK